MAAQGVRSESTTPMSFDGALKHLFGLEKKLRVEMLENIKDLKVQMTANRIDLVAKKATKLFEIRHQLYSSKVLYRQEKDIMDEFEKLKVILESVPNAEDNGWNRAKADCFVLGAQLNEVRKRQSTLSVKVQELERNVEELLSVPLDDLDSYDIESLKREEIQYEKSVPTLSSYSMKKTTPDESNFPQKTPALKTFQPISVEKIELDPVEQPLVEVSPEVALEPQKSVEVIENQIQLDHSEEPLAQIIEPLEAYAANENTRSEIDQMLRDFEEQGDLKQEIFGSWLAAKESQLKKETEKREEDGQALLEETHQSKPTKKKKKKAPKADPEIQTESEENQDNKFPSFYKEQVDDCWSEASKQITERVQEEEKITQQMKQAEERALFEEKQKIDAENKIQQKETQEADEQKMHQEAKILEDMKAAEEKRIAEGEKLAQEAKIQEELRQLEEQRLNEEAKIFEDLKAAEDLRIKEQEQFAQEAKAQGDLKSAKEEKLAKEARLQEEQKLVKELKIQEEQRLVEEARIQEKQRLAEEVKIQEEQRLAEEVRIQEEQRLAEEVRIQEEQRLVEDARIQEEQRLAEEARIQEEQRLAEEKRIQGEQRLAEEAKVQEEKRLAEEAKVQEEKRLAEEVRIQEEQRLAEEVRIQEEQRLAEEVRIQEEQRLAEEARIHEEQRLAEEAKVQEEKRFAEEVRIKEEQRLAEEVRIQEEKRLADEAKVQEEKRLAKEAKIQEEQRLAEEAKIQEEQRLAEEARIHEEQRLAAEMRIQEEQRLAEEVRIQEEKRLADEAKVQEEKRLAKEAKIQEEQRLAEEARIHEEQRLAEEMRIQEEQRLAENARIQEEQRLVEDARIQEERRLAEEVRIQEEKRLADEAKVQEEKRLTEQGKLQEEQREAEGIKYEEEQRAVEQVRIAEESQLSNGSKRKQESPSINEVQTQEAKALVADTGFIENVEALEATNDPSMKGDESNAQMLNDLQRNLGEDQGLAEQSQIGKKMMESVKGENLLGDPNTLDELKAKKQMIAKETGNEKDPQQSSAEKAATEKPTKLKEEHSGLDEQKCKPLDNSSNDNSRQEEMPDDISRVWSTNGNDNNKSAEETKIISMQANPGESQVRQMETNDPLQSSNEVDTSSNEKDATKRNEFQHTSEDEIQDSAKSNQEPPKRKKKAPKPLGTLDNNSSNVTESGDAMDGLKMEVQEEPDLPSKPEKKARKSKASDNQIKNIAKDSQQGSETQSGNLDPDQDTKLNANGQQSLSENGNSHQDCSKDINHENEQAPNNAHGHSKEHIFESHEEVHALGNHSPSVPQKTKKKKKVPTPNDTNEAQSDQTQMIQSKFSEDAHPPTKPEKKKHGHKENKSQEHLLEQPDEPKRSRSELRELSAANEDEARLLQDMEEQNLERIEAEFAAHKMVMEQEAQMEQDELNKVDTSSSGDNNTHSKPDAIPNKESDPKGGLRSGMEKDVGVGLDVNEKVSKSHTTDSLTSQNLLSKPEVQKRSKDHEVDEKSTSKGRTNQIDKKFQDKNKANDDDDDVNKAKTELDLEPMMLSTNEMSPEISESVSSAKGGKGSKQPLDQTSPIKSSRSKQKSPGTVTWEVDEKEAPSVEEPQYSKIKKNKGKKTPSNNADESRTYLNKGLLETEFPVLEQSDKKNEEEDIYSKPIKPKKKATNTSADVPYDVPKSPRSIESSPEPHYHVPNKGSKSKVTVQDLQRAKARIKESQTSLDKASTSSKIDGKKAKPSLVSIIDLEIPESEPNPNTTDQANGAKHLRDKNKTDKVSSGDEEAHHDDDNELSKDTFNTTTQAQKPDNGSSVFVAKDTDKLYSSDFDYTDLDTVEQQQQQSWASPIKSNPLEEGEEDTITHKTSRAKKLSNTFKSLIKRDKPEDESLIEPLNADHDKPKAKRSLLNFIKKEKETPEPNVEVGNEKTEEDSTCVTVDDLDKNELKEDQTSEETPKVKQKKGFKALFQRDKSSNREEEAKTENHPVPEKPKTKRNFKNLIGRDSSLSKEQTHLEETSESTANESKPKRTFKNFIKRDSSTKGGEEPLKDEPRELKGLNDLASKFSRPANWEQDSDSLKCLNEADGTIEINAAKIQEIEDDEDHQISEDIEDNQLEQDIDRDEITQDTLEPIHPYQENSEFRMEQESISEPPKPLNRKNKPTEVKFSNEIAIVVENVDKVDQQTSKPIKEKSLFRAFMRPKDSKTNEEPTPPPGLGKLMTGKQALLKHPSPKQRVMSLDRKGKSNKQSGSKIAPPTPDEEHPHSIENIPIPPQKRTRSLDRRALKQQDNQGETLPTSTSGDIPHIAQITPCEETPINVPLKSFKSPTQNGDSSPKTQDKGKKPKEKKDKMPEELRKKNFKTVDELKLPNPPVPKRGNKLKRSSSMENMRRASLLLQVPGWNTLPKQRSRSADTRTLEQEINAGVSFQAIAPLVQEIAEERNLRLKEINFERFDTTLPKFNVDMPDMTSKARERNERLKVVQQPYTAILQPPKPERRRSKSTEISTLPRQGATEMPVKPKRSKSRDASLQRLKQKTPYSVTELQKLQERKKQLTLDFMDLQIKTGQVREKLKTPVEKNVVLAAIADTSLLSGRRGRGLTRQEDEARRKEAIEKDHPPNPKIVTGARMEQTWDQVDFFGKARKNKFDTLDSGISEYKDKYYYSSDDEDGYFEDPSDSALDQQNMTLDSMGRPKKVSFASLQEQWKLKMPHKIPNEDKSWPALPQGPPERPFQEVPRASPGLLHARMEENEPLRNKASPNLNFIMQQQVSREQPKTNENNYQDTSPRAFLDAMTGGRISGPSGSTLPQEPSVPKDDGGGLFGSLMKKSKGLSSKKTSRASSRTNSTERGSVLKRVFHKASSAEPISKKSETLGSKATRKITLPLPNRMTEAASVGNFATLASPEPDTPNVPESAMSKKNKKSNAAKIEAIDFDKLFERGHAQSSAGGLNLVDSRLLGSDGSNQQGQTNSSLSYEEKVQSFLDDQNFGGSSQIPIIDKNELRSHYSTRIDPSPNRSRNTSKADVKSKPKFKIRSRDSSISSRPGQSRPVSPLDFLKKLEGLAKEVEVEREYEENVWPAVNPNIPGVFDTRPPSQRDTRKDGSYAEPSQSQMDAFNSMNLSPRGQGPRQTERKLSTSNPEQVLSSLIIQPPLAQTNLPPPLSPSLRTTQSSASNNFYSAPNQFTYDVTSPSNSNQDSLDPNSAWARTGNDQGPPIPPNRRPSSPWALNVPNQQQPMAQPRRKSIGAQFAAQDPSGTGQFLSTQNVGQGQSRSASHSPNRHGSDNTGSGIPMNVPADRHLPARLLPDPLSKDLGNLPGANSQNTSRNVEDTELYKRLHDGLQTVENLILSSPFHQEQQIEQRTKDHLHTADQSGPQTMSSQVYSQNLGRAEFGTLRKRDQTQRASGGASAVASRDPSGERPRSRATSGTFATNRPNAFASRQNSQESNLSHLSDSHYPDLEFNTYSRPGSSLGTRSPHGGQNANVPTSGDHGRSNWIPQRPGSSLNPSPMVLEKKKAVLERIEKEKQLVKEAKSQMLILLLLGLCICILIYLQSEEA